MAQHFYYPPQSASITGSITVDQGTSPWVVTDPAAEASLASIDGKLTNPLPVSGPLTDAQLRASAVPVSAAALPLPAGAATALKQDTGNTSLASIDSKLTNPLPVSGPLTDAQLRASAVPVSAAALPLPSGAATETTLAAFSAKSAGALVPAAFDYIALTYTGSNVTSAVYKTGGVGGSTVATLTLAYTGSQLDSVTKT